jgi:hypothetical protein
VRVRGRQAIVLLATRFQGIVPNSVQKQMCLYVLKHTRKRQSVGTAIVMTNYTSVRIQRKTQFQQADLFLSSGKKLRQHSIKSSTILTRG